jgi:16S rRNA (adenine1518-N6/adenine1519-N6)-dimethyltransferase
MLKAMSKPENNSKQPFEHKKSLGQNFLTSDIVPGWMCTAAALTPGETVLEIGAGTGRLTRELLARGAKVVAIETDSRAVASLTETFSQELATGQLTLHYGDARFLTPTELGLTHHSYKVVANIPYFLSGLLLRLMLEQENQPNTLVFLMQKELVARITRDPKASLLSLGVKAFGDPKYVKTVSRGHFYPVPKVDSAILAVTNISLKNFATIDKTFFFSLLHLGLGKKRKQLLTNLAEHYNRTELSTLFTELGLALSVRGEDVSLSDWLKLAQSLPPKSDLTL